MLEAGFEPRDSDSTSPHTHHKNVLHHTLTLNCSQILHSLKAQFSLPSGSLSAHSPTHGRPPSSAPTALTVDTKEFNPCQYAVPLIQFHTLHSNILCHCLVASHRLTFLSQFISASLEQSTASFVCCFSNKELGQMG